MSNELATQTPRVTSQDRLLSLVQNRYPNYHPVVAMVELAHVSEDESVQFSCHKEVARYVVAVDKFVEVKSEIVKTKRVVVELFGAEDQPKALEANASPVLDVHGHEITDVVDKVALPLGAARADMETIKQRVAVMTHGQVEDEEPQAQKRDVLLGAWGDGTSVGAERFA